MFSYLLVCVFVCLLATLRKTAGTDFHEIFRVCGIWHRELSGTWLACTVEPLEHRKSFSTFAVSNITGNWMKRFSLNFQQRLNMRQRTIWNILGMLQLTPWIQDRFFFFFWICDCWSYYGKKHANGFLWNFHEIFGATQEIISWTVARLTRLSHSLPSRRSGVSGSNITAK